MLAAEIKGHELLPQLVPRVKLHYEGLPLRRLHATVKIASLVEAPYVKAIRYKLHLRVHTPQEGLEPSTTR